MGRSNLAQEFNSENLWGYNLAQGQTNYQEWSLSGHVTRNEQFTLYRGFQVGHYKTWTLDYGLDSGLDSGPDYGLDMTRKRALPRRGTR